MVLCCYFSIISLCYNYCVQQKNSTTIATHIIVTAKTDIVLFTQVDNLCGNPIDSSSTSSADDKEVLNKQKIEQDDSV